MHWKHNPYGTLCLVDAKDWEDVRVEYGKTFWLCTDNKYLAVAYTPHKMESLFPTIQEAKAWVELLAKLTRN